ncbi:MAG: hypothetical protein HOA90_21005 [Prolixibacteraceae bacterium]|nr:hypothetical protein [Prolixibacteraceae bacterium]
MKYCDKTIPSSSKYDELQRRKCHLPEGHNGRCSEFPFLKHLNQTFKRVSDKIKRDSTMTTGAAWKSSDAGPNRILRWVMLESDESLAKYGINMDELKDGVKAKLKDKAADYDSCIQVSIKLSWLVYQMEGAPECPADIKDYLESHCGKMGSNTLCSICLEEIPFELFHTAQRGKANIETCHLNPRLHDSENVGFGHRECNITQGNKTLEEFYEWISSILNRLNN